MITHTHGQAKKECLLWQIRGIKVYAEISKIYSLSSLDFREKSKLNTDFYLFPADLKLIVAYWSTVPILELKYFYYLAYSSI